jgi:hypothetical protein
MNSQHGGFKSAPKPNQSNYSSWEEEFDDKMGNYTDGLPEMYIKGVKPDTKGFWLRSGMDGELDERAVKDFIRQTVSQETSRLIDEIEAKLPEETYKNPDYDMGWSDAIDQVKTILEELK